MTVDGFDLTGKRALIVGQTAVGSTIAHALKVAGADVVAGGMAGGDEVKRLLEKQAAESGYRAGPAPADADALIRVALEYLGGLDILVSSSDLRAAGPFEELTDAGWDRLVAVNLTTAVRLLRAAGREMVARGGGQIIQVVSLLGERGVPNTAAYGACQAALIHLIRALALEWARRSVRVNGIGLGWFENDPLVGTRPHPSPLPEGEEAHSLWERAGVRATEDQLLKYLPMRRLGRPDEVGALAVYLASDASDMMTGQTIWVDGGAMSHA